MASYLLAVTSATYTYKPMKHSSVYRLALTAAGLCLTVLQARSQQKTEPRLHPDTAAGLNTIWLFTKTLPGEGTAMPVRRLDGFYSNMPVRKDPNNFYSPMPVAGLKKVFSPDTVSKNRGAESGRLKFHFPAGPGRR
ncbi:hypothetical protein C7T94_10490 [Pedobacter yulinensis]|uniref:Uncharacterized protein n=1 Tax=Pedobacter yulinensis TaxID=2126353 RepID=A0A2T3HKV8_9SPHI|nr:hypothetical protein C7T94_10490 [Pedobacter yulinensis]